MKSLPWIFISLAFLLIAGGLFWIFYYEMPSGNLNNNAWQERALRGDFWGGHLTAITSFAGTLLFVAGLLFQTSELKLQRQDMELSREVSRKQVIELEKQTEIAKHQAIVMQIIEIANYCHTLKKEYNTLEEQLPHITSEYKKKHFDRMRSLKYRILACDFSHRNLISNDVLSDDEKELFADMTKSGQKGDDYELNIDPE